MLFPQYPNGLCHHTESNVTKQIFRKHCVARSSTRFQFFPTAKLVPSINDCHQDPKFKIKKKKSNSGSPPLSYRNSTKCRLSSVSALRLHRISPPTLVSLTKPFPGHFPCCQGGVLPGCSNDTHITVLRCPPWYRAPFITAEFSLPKSLLTRDNKLLS